MSSRFDITDDRFKIAANEDVIEFIRRTNPSTHSDPGDVLFKLGKAIPGARSYCPSTKTFAYVVLHTDADRIFAIAFGMHGLAFRIPSSVIAEAVADGGTLEPKIGPDWVRFPPFNGRGETGAWERLLRWGGQAFTEAQAA